MAKGESREGEAAGRPSRRRFLVTGARATAAVVASTFGAPRDARGASPAPSHGGSAGRDRTSSLAPVSYELRLAPDEFLPAGQAVPGMLVNGSFPASEIRFREGFLLRVQVASTLAEPTAIHWHGLSVPNPMDGVIGATQLPLEAGTVGVYEIPAREPGTFWYHSTEGLQRQLGIAGALVIEEKEDPFDVDRDAVLFLSDWPAEPPAEIVARLAAAGPSPTASPASSGSPPRSIHALPDGSPFPTDVSFTGFALNGRSYRNAWTVSAKEGSRLRFRIVNGSAQTFFRFRIEGHALEVVAADGRRVEPVVVDDLVVATGERYDALVTVGKSGSYTIRAVALGQSGGAVGVLHTPDAKAVVATAPPVWGDRHLRYEQLRALEPTTLPDGPLRELRMKLAERSPTYRFTVNGASYPGLLAPDGTVEPLRIQPGERVRLEIENATRFFQPMHLHGHAFRLLASDGAAYGGDAGTASERAPRKDTVAVAPGGKVRIELLADNPGRWLLESMALYRRQAGLAGALQYVVVAE